MKRKESILKNTSIGFLGQVVPQVLQFLIRKFILMYIGIEVLGIGSTLASVLATLSLAELGFQNAVVFYLYKPLNEQNHEKVNQILTILKRVYEMMGIFFIGLTILAIPALKHILIGVNITNSVIAYYGIMSINLSLSYFFAYKRALLYADQKEYVSKFIDSTIGILLGCVQIAAIIVCRSYVLFLILQVLQTVLSNLFIHIFCRKKYVYLQIVSFRWDLFKRIGKDVKNIFMGKIAGYVYGATDNLVISTFMGTVKVGYLSNYTVLINAIKIVVNSIFNAMTPVIGNLIIDTDDRRRREFDFRTYAYVRYLLATIIVIPWVVLSNEIVVIFWGKQYIMTQKIAILLAIDLYIHIVYSACCEYINGAGLFKADKYISLLGAISNITLSIVFVVNLGVEGVLIGTAISQVIFWVGRSAVVYKRIFGIGRTAYAKYVLKNVLWGVSVWSVIRISCRIKQFLTVENNILSMLVIFFICELVNVMIQALLLPFLDETQRLKAFIKRK